MNYGRQSIIWDRLVKDERIPSCPLCGSWVSPDDDRAEVVNKRTGARGIAHAECYLADTCCYELA